LSSVLLLCLLIFFLFLFSLLCRPPPRSTLFPYTTLFRSHIARRYSLSGFSFSLSAAHLSDSGRNCQTHGQSLLAPHRLLRSDGRSEEHTSELQSPYDLVCRLLLEKKKKNKTKNNKHK